MAPIVLDSRVTALCSDCFTHEVALCDTCREPHGCHGHTCRG